MLQWPFYLQQEEFIFLVMTSVSLLIICFYYFYFFLRLAIQKERSQLSSEFPGVSVIICAKNESQNIMDLLPKILEQDYPHFEVIVVNDASWDETGDELDEMKRIYPQLQIVTITESLQYRPGKKFALTLGIKKAQYEHLVLTDADCAPASQNWLKEMAGSFSTEKKLVLGIGVFAVQSTLVNALIRFENYLTGTFYLSFALAGFPYMGVGRNLAYTKGLYNKVGGFKNHYHIVSGDDDLFVKEAGTASNTAVCLSPDSIMVSKAPVTWSAWSKQKKRHYSTSSHYRITTQFMLGLYPLSVILFLVGVIGMSVFQNLFYIALSVLFFKLILQLIIFRGAFKKQGDQFLWLFSPLFELLLIFNQMILLIASKLSKQIKWN
jgi:cellulose synthase/poly-beta-1,6-N-acetylglucosamine synthase-like glycosyltransferase